MMQLYSIKTVIYIFNYFMYTSILYFSAITYDDVFITYVFILVNFSFSYYNYNDYITIKFISLYTIMYVFYCEVLFIVVMYIRKTRPGLSSGPTPASSARAASDYFHTRPIKNLPSYIEIMGKLWNLS